MYWGEKCRGERVVSSTLWPYRFAVSSDKPLLISCGEGNGSSAGTKVMVVH